MTYEFYGPGLGTNGDTTPPASTEPAAPAEESETLFEQGWEWFREVAGGKNGQQQVEQPASMPGATAASSPTAAGFSQYASEAAIREVAVVDEEQAPIQEVPSDAPDGQEDERSWIEQYQTHITIASTLVGLGTFIIWLAVRKKD